MNRLARMMIAASAMGVVLALSACSPATGFETNEDRWTANQTTQPVGYKPVEHAPAQAHPAAPAAKEAPKADEAPAAKPAH